MFDWFRKKDETPLEFPDNQSAFEHACTIGYLPLIQASIPALVMEEGRRGVDGEHYFLMRLAGQNSFLEVWGCTLPGAPAFPVAGDLVAFRIVRICPELPVSAGLIGYISGSLDPVLIGKKRWRIRHSYTPDSLKPELHLG